MSYYDQPRNPPSQNLYFDAFSSQATPYNFYFNPKNVIYQPFAFAKRISRIDFDYMSDVDVIQISRTGDIQSVMNLLFPIAFANITQVEAQEFGSKGAVHSFMILQMAVEYYLDAVSRLTWKVHQLREELKKKSTISSGFDERIKANYESQIQILKKDKENRDMAIDNLTEKYAILKRDRDTLRNQLESLKKRTHLHKFRPKDLEIERQPSEGEITLPAQFDLNKAQPKETPKRVRKTRSQKVDDQSIKKSKERSKPKSKPKQFQHGYQDLNSESSQYESHISEKQFEEQPDNHSYWSSLTTSSSGWV